ncbi:hypothetical protein SAY87_019893 [Trapa incisa]|uniref:Uncharacterized protein n=1 Tax=Trapa incisa TaxID=236973 RepID=A0AAN7K332_9MYRT|nr:hypothetical protein SAY87_019893 [Trapa incisa]
MPTTTSLLFLPSFPLHFSTNLKMFVRAKLMHSSSLTPLFSIPQPPPPLHDTYDSLISLGTGGGVYRRFGTTSQAESAGGVLLSAPAMVHKGESSSERVDSLTVAEMNPPAWRANSDEVFFNLSLQYRLQ